MESNIGKCQRFARKTLDLLGFNDLETPAFRVVTKTGAKWAGLHTYHYFRATRTGHSDIQIQTYVADGGDRSLERIVAHEVIHFIIFATREFHYARRVEHGKEFLELRAKLNAVLGEDFVQLHCDKDFERGALRKPILLVMWKKAANPGPVIAWFARETPKVRRILMRMGAMPGSETRVAVTRDAIWSNYPKLATCRFSYAHDHLEAEAQKLWEQGQCVVLPA